MTRPHPFTLVVSVIGGAMLGLAGCSNTLEGPPAGASAGSSSSSGGSSSGAAGSGTAGSDSEAGEGSGGSASTTGGAAGSAGSAGNAGSGGSVAGEPAGTGFARLTRVEYHATVREALGIEPDLSLVPEDGRSGAYTSNATVTTDPVHPYLLSGEDLALAVIPDVMPACSGATAAGCVETDYADALGRLFRRSLTTSEIGAWALLIDELRAAGVSPEDATRAMLAGALLSPDFLFRSTPVAGDEARARALAEHLAYALWDAPPDAALHELGLRPASELPALLGSEARRLATDARATSVLARFVAQWLHVDTDLRLSDPAFATSPSYLELLALVKDALENETPVRSLVSSTRGFVHPDNAAAYALASAPSGSTVAAVTWPADSARRGLLAQELFADSTRHPDPSRRPIFRGKLVRTSLLCDSIPPPSADLLALDQEVDDRTTDPRCAGCHLLLEPIGQVFDALDADHEGQTQAAEIVEHAELAGTYDDLPSLLEAVAGSRAFAECFARSWLGFFLEQAPGDIEASFVSELADGVQSGATLVDVVERTAVGLEQRTRTATPWCEGP